MNEMTIQQKIEVLKMAKEMVEQDYFNKRDIEMSVWSAKNSKDDKEVPEYSFIPYPATSEILSKAKELYKFILK